MRRKSQVEIELERRLAELYKKLEEIAEKGFADNYLYTSEPLQIEIEQVKYELSRFDARRDARRVSTREWANFALTVLSVAAAILIAIFKKGG